VHLHKITSYSFV